MSSMVGIMVTLPNPPYGIVRRGWCAVEPKPSRDCVWISGGRTLVQVTHFGASDELSSEHKEYVLQSLSSLKSCQDVARATAFGCDEGSPFSPFCCNSCSKCRWRGHTACAGERLHTFPAYNTRAHCMAGCDALGQLSGCCEFDGAGQCHAYKGSKTREGKGGSAYVNAGCTRGLSRHTARSPAILHPSVHRCRCWKCDGADSWRRVL